MTTPNFDLLRFDEGYFERIWGGRRLASVFGKKLPNDARVGEAWLISDHPQHGSVVTGGQHDGRTLRSLMEQWPEAILGTHARPIANERFPLLLKLLDAQDDLSIQVHPNDDEAKRLGEADGGKTEMWHILDGEAGAEIICGMEAGVSTEGLRQAIGDGQISKIVKHFKATSGMSMFVRAGTVHAIGRGVMLAEIQQNSDVTYRVYDWGRVEANGKPRELHVEKALEVIRLGEQQCAPTGGLRVNQYRSVHAACEYFATERIDVGKSPNAISRDTRGASFHLIMCISGSVEVASSAATESLAPGEALMVCGSTQNFELSGDGSALDYYVPDLQVDIVEPLRTAGHSDAEIAELGVDLT